MSIADFPNSYENREYTEFLSHSISSESGLKRTIEREITPKIDPKFKKSTQNRRQNRMDHTRNDSKLVRGLKIPLSTYNKEIQVQKGKGNEDIVIPLVK